MAKTKGYQWGRKNLVRMAKTAVLHAGVNAYRDRKRKKREMRGLFQIRISAFAKEHDLSYSRFIDLLKKNNIDLDRKVLADLAANNSIVLANLLAQIKK